MKKNILFTLVVIVSIIGCNSTEDSLITIDTHDDINTMYFTDSLNYTMDTDTKLNLPKMIAGGLDVAWLVVYTAQGELNDQGYAAAMENAIDKFDAIDRLVNKYAPDQISHNYACGSLFMDISRNHAAKADCVHTSY